MNSDFKKYLLQITQARACSEMEVIQSLWSGYGKISRYQLMDSSVETVVVKQISLQPSKDHPRGWSTEVSHLRKVKSYKVETHWYKKWSQQCSEGSKIPKFIGSFSQGKDHWIIMEDLKVHYPKIKDQITFPEVHVGLKWLANFHAQFLGQKPNGLWAVGTYWHLATRPDEFEKLDDIELKAKAPIVDRLLNECKFQTFVHGDAKLANFCFSTDGTKVAAVDFQYVGGGCGMKDVAYFLGSCLSSDACETHQEELLKSYFFYLHQALEIHAFQVDFNELEKEWRQLYPVACADFTRFLLGWMPTHQKVNAYHLDQLKSVMEMYGVF